MEMLSWHAITSDVYYAAEASTLKSNCLYFLTDTGELFRGTVPFTESCIIYSGALPTKPARKRIYVNSGTGEGKIYTGTEWVTVIKPVVDTISADGTDPVNSKAVIAYVTSAINDVTGGATVIKNVGYTKEGVKLTVTKGDDTSTDVVLEGLAVNVNYDANTGKLKLLDVKGNAVGSEVNLGLDRFVKSAEYDADTKTISLYFDEEKTDKLDIPVGDLVDTYTAENSNSVTLTVTNNKFTADVIVAATEGNMLQKTDEGLFVAATDTSKLQKLVTSASVTAIPMLNAAGQVINGTHTIGGDALAASPAGTVLATELAVSALVSATKAEIETELAKKMALVESANVDNFPMLNAAGQVINGTKKAGGATLAETTDANTLATEKAVEAAITAAAAGKVDKTSIVTTVAESGTDEEVPSAKAVYEAMCWKTTI